MQLYYLSSQKGGVGKTTFGWHTACALKMLHPDARVAFVDATHVQGSRSLSLAHDKEVAGEGFGRALAVLQGGIIPGLSWDQQRKDLDEAAIRAYAAVKNAMTAVLISDGLSVSFIPAAHAVLSEALKRWREESRGELLTLLLSKFEFDYCIIDTIGDPSGVLQESILHVADSCVFFEDLRDYEALAGFGTLVNDARKAGVKIAGAVGNFLNPSIKMGDKKSTTKSAIALGVFTETCFNAGIEVLDVFKSNVTTLASAMNVHKKDGVMASSMYIEMKESPSNRKNLELLARRIETLAHKLEVV
jgi:cellulose biosynthesis protein BcsQ